ncbi:MAG: glycosyltransferase family 9 protein [Gemmatimonadaceae bacterium]
MAAEAAAPALRLAARAWARGPASPPASWRRGLILGHTHIGDLLYRTASLPPLRRALPACEWDILAAPQSAAVLRGNPHLAAALPVNVGDAGWDLAPGAFRQLRDARYDVVLCTNNESFYPDFALAAALGVPTRVGFPYKGLSGLINVGVPIPYPAPWAAYVRAMVAAVCGLEPTWSLRPQIFPSAADEAAAERVWGEVVAAADRPVIATAITARQAAAAWPAGHWADSFRPLAADEGAVIVLCGAPSERPLLERAAATAGFPVRIVAGELGLTGVAALLRRCALFVGPDSGLRHVANAARTPVLFCRNPSSHPVETGRYCDTEVDLLPPTLSAGSATLADALRAYLSPAAVTAAVRRALGGGVTALTGAAPESRA